MRVCVCVWVWVCLDITPLTALQSHLCSLHFSRMTAPQAEEAVWLLSLVLSLPHSLTDFFLLYFLIYIHIYIYI